MFPVFKKLSDQERHDYILQTYVLNKSQSAASQKHKRDIDVIKEHHKFLWENDDTPETWEEQLARRYYDKLFKEYCIADLTRFKENKVALRWRIESEVVSGKGQFQCGCRKCDEHEELKSWEVNFAYQEDGVRKNALVKLRLCPEHSAQLNYKSHKREIKRLKRVEKHQKKTEKRRNRKSKKQTGEEQNVSTSDLEVETSNQLEVEEEPRNNEAKDIPSPSNHNNKTQELAENIWSQKLEIESEKESRESEFERYLEDLLL